MKKSKLRVIGMALALMLGLGTAADMINLMSVDQQEALAKEGGEQKKHKGGLRGYNESLLAGEVLKGGEAGRREESRSIGGGRCFYFQIKRSKIAELN